MKNNKRKDVGYGRPPVDKQFKPGQSGNSKGRPKGRKNTMTILQEILDSKVTVTENDKKIKMSRRSIMLTQGVNKAMKGDIRAISLFLPVMFETDANAEDKDNILKALKTDDKKIVKNFFERHKGDKSYGDK